MNTDAADIQECVDKLEELKLDELWLQEPDDSDNPKLAEAYSKLQEAKLKLQEAVEALDRAVFTVEFHRAVSTLHRYGLPPPTRHPHDHQHHQNNSSR